MTDPAPAAPPAQPTPTYTPATGAVDQQNSRTLAAVAYILTWVTGLIIFFVAPKEDKYARWHAIQAIGLGIASTVLIIIINIIDSFLFFFGLLGTLVWLGTVVLVIILAVKAYQGERIRLPIIADMADKNA